MFFRIHQVPQQPMREAGEQSHHLPGDERHLGAREQRAQLRHRLPGESASADTDRIQERDQQVEDSRVSDEKANECQGGEEEDQSER